MTTDSTRELLESVIEPDNRRVLLVTEGTQSAVVKELLEASTAGAFRVVVAKPEDVRRSPLDFNPTLQQLMPFQRLNEDGSLSLSSEPFTPPNQPWYNRHRNQRTNRRRSR